ncbi:P-loop containing nucleoside triphosphate hydrolase [Ostreococcus tauri]|uniref:P-loop containing nucleoside triphosphate hydrolase n=1 Tax=Ostreococcus tauri TaxID=70448 RepID=A0A090MAR7_OSTTA|nr:P-loop containing nucleoside triphosphate hydrolase [Ostreococcus tauri]CEF99817.1 P-loop containing nucleoside triphosphate hydrolase [Ostreococcus tauri]|eukprot:XP_003082246.2 P-loop containing nucleoside triphosphate hydrolase [Ostreococcus tauri]
MDADAPLPGAVARTSARAAYENLSTLRAQTLDARPIVATGDGDDARVPGAIRIARDVLEAAIASSGASGARAMLTEAGVDARGTAVVLAEADGDAEFVARTLMWIGLDAAVVDGGYGAWIEAGYPTIGKRWSEEGAKDGTGARRLIVWANPRSRSTAFERSLSMHSRAMVMHEMLTEPYLKERNPENYEKIVNGQTSQEIESSVCGYSTALEVLTADFSGQGKPFLISKELSCYFDDEKITDEWLLAFNHVVLTRNPLDALKSFYRVAAEGDAESSYFDVHEAGFVECLDIMHRLNRIGARCLAIDADNDLMKNPEGSLRATCELVGMDFEESMLSWNAQERPSWKKFRDWHADASKSTGFIDVKKVDIPYSKEVYDGARWCKPYYDAVLWSSVGVMEGWPTLRRLAHGEHRLTVVICANGEHAGRDMHAKFLAARLPGASVYIFQPKWVEEAESEDETRCLSIFEQPLVLCGSLGKVVEMNQALQTRLKYGSSKVARALIVEEGASGAPVVALPFPQTVVRSRDTMEDDVFIAKLSKMIDIELEALRASSESDTDFAVFDPTESSP